MVHRYVSLCSVFGCFAFCKDSSVLLSCPLRSLVLLLMGEKSLGSYWTFWWRPHFGRVGISFVLFNSRSDFHFLWELYISKADINISFDQSEHHRTIGWREFIWIDFVIRIWWSIPLSPIRIVLTLQSWSRKEKMVGKKKLIQDVQILISMKKQLHNLRTSFWATRNRKCLSFFSKSTRPLSQVNERSH